MESEFLLGTYYDHGSVLGTLRWQKEESFIVLDVRHMYGHVRQKYPGILNSKALASNPDDIIE